jgi:uncharacterized protein
MPHLRTRFALDILKKKLKFSRIVSIQGARQTGKSVLARDLFQSGIYTTLDQSKVRSEALERPEVFIETLRQKAVSKETVVIDEAQKAPPLFDEIKSVVDLDKRPGQFLLLGSTEFSHETKIKESLTGRLSRLRLYPLTLSETLGFPQADLSFFKQKNQSNIKRTELIRFLNQGGLPAVFSVRNEQERFDKLSEWLSLTSERDVTQVLRMKANPDLCARILELIPILEEPTLASLSSRLKRSGRTIQAQLKILKLIFAIHELNPHPLSTGKTLYYLIDPSLVLHLKGEFSRALETALLTDFLARQSYLEKIHYRLSFYRTSKGSFVHFLLEQNANDILAIKVSDSEKLDQRDTLVLDSLHKKMAENQIKLSSLITAGVSQRSKLNEHTVLPWESLF